MILSFFMGRKDSSFSPEAIIDQVFNSFKKILQSLIILIICSILFCILAGNLINRSLDLMDNQNLHFSNSIILLLVLLVVDTLVIVWSLRKVVDKPQSQQAQKQSTSASSSPIESAVAALIFDFVKERESKRSHKEDPSN